MTQGVSLGIAFKYWIHLLGSRP